MQKFGVTIDFNIMIKVDNNRNMTELKKNSYVF